MAFTAGSDICWFLWDFRGSITISSTMWAAAIQNGRILGLVPKIWIPNYSEFYEKAILIHGSSAQ